jgi:hypothetical protein
MFKLFLIVFFFLSVYSQDSVWANCYKGKVFFRVYNKTDWQLIVNKEKISVMSDILSEKGSLFVINDKLTSYDFDNEHYFYLKYLFIQNKSELVLELTKLDLKNLKSPVDLIQKKKIGKTYGYKPVDSKLGNLDKRERSILHFIYNDYEYAALLEEKRLLTFLPSLYENELHLNNLIYLLKKIGLNGFLRDELEFASKQRLNINLRNIVHLAIDSLNKLN